MLPSRLPEYPAPGVKLHCAECDATYSAYRSDYWLLLDQDLPIECCEKPLRLVRETRAFVVIDAA